jgi:O-antigen/teichoic acid export membrane protein
MKKNVVYVALSVFGVQGAAYLGQFILAGMLPAEQFAIVRTVEASLQLLSAIAPLGVSLLVVRLAAQTTDPQALGRSLSSYLAFALVAGIAVAGICSLLIGAFGQRDADPYLLGMLWVLVLTNISRTALNFLYGKERFATVSVTNFIIALCYLAVLVALVKLVGLPGWIGAKYLIETAFLVVSLAFVWRHLGRIIASARLYAELAREGMAVSLSLLFRTGLDTMPLLILAYLGASAQDVATFGLCTLMVAAAMILPASLNTVLLPKYAQVLKTEPDALQALHNRYQKLLVMAGVALILALTVCGLLIEEFFGNKYSNLTLTLIVLSLAIPAKLISTINANVLFAKSKTHIGTTINGCTLAVCVLLCFIASETFNLSDLSLAIAGIALMSECIASLQFLAITRRLLVKGLATQRDSKSTNPMDS